MLLRGCCYWHMCTLMLLTRGEYDVRTFLFIGKTCVVCGNVNLTVPGAIGSISGLFALSAAHLLLHR